MGYTRMPNDYTTPDSPVGAISEQEAIMGKGFKVHISGIRRTGVRQFTVESLNAQSFFTRKNFIYIVAAATLVLCIIGGIFMKVYPPYRIGTVLDYPSATCTILSYTEVSGGRSQSYTAEVQYYDSNNQSHIETMSGIGYSTWNSRGWTVGSNFTCLYRGSYVIDKQTIQDEYDTAESLWFLGFIIPLPLMLMQGGMILFVLHLQAKQGTTLYFPRSFTADEGDSNLVINEWGPVPTKLHQNYYLLLHTYYSKESSFLRNVSFRKPIKDKSAFAKAILTFASVFMIVCFLGFLGLGGWLLSDLDFILYLLAVLMFECGLFFLPLGIWMFSILRHPRLTVDADDLVIEAIILEHKIKGTIRVKPSTTV